MNNTIIEDRCLLEKDIEHLEERQLNIYINLRGLKNNILYLEWRRILDFYDFENLYTTKIDHKTILIFKYQGIPVLVDLHRDNETIDWEDKLDQFEQSLISSIEYSKHFNLENSIFYLNLFQGGVFSDQGDFDIQYSKVSDDDKSTEKWIEEVKRTYPDSKIIEKQLKSGLYFIMFLPNTDTFSIKDYPRLPHRMNLPERIYKPKINIIDKTSRMREMISSWSDQDMNVMFKEFLNLRIWNKNGLHGHDVQRLEIYICELLKYQFNYDKCKSFFNDHWILNESPNEFILFEHSGFGRKLHTERNPQKRNHTRRYRKHRLMDYIFDIKKMCSEYRSKNKLQNPSILVLNSNGLHEYRDPTWRPIIVEYLKSL